MIVNLLLNMLDPQGVSAALLRRRSHQQMAMMADFFQLGVGIEHIPELPAQ